MKILLIHASAGQGHKMVAEAIKETAVEIFGEESVEIVDILNFTSRFFKTVYSRGYVFAISHLAWLWAILFFLSDTRYLRLINYNLRRFTNKFFCRNFLEFLKKEDPEVIISTHFLVNELVSQLKESNEIGSKLVSVITDFGVHNFWIASNVDLYVVASNRTKEILVSKGIGFEKIKVLGIPVRRQFERQLDRAEIRKKLSLANREFTALILTGGIGIGPIYEIVKTLKDEINVIVVCGSNKKLSQELRKLDYKNLVVLGWIDYVEEVMAVSDIAITKPGGSSISECLIMGLPMIFFSIIPGQEAQNSKIISEYNLGFILDKPLQIKDKLAFLKKDRGELESIRNRISVFKAKDSAKKILELIND